MFPQQFLDCRYVESLATEEVMFASTKTDRPLDQLCALKHDSGNVSDLESRNIAIVVSVVMQVVTLDFDFFNIVSNRGIVTLYDGPDDNSPLIATLTGTYSQLPKGFTTTAEYMFVKFTNNATTNFLGFSATYRTTTTSESSFKDA
jgi:hypothetical protein